MAKYPKHAQGRYTGITNTPDVIKNLEIIDKTVRENQERRKRNATKARDAAEKKIRQLRIATIVFIIAVLSIGSVISFNIIDNSRFAYAYDLPRIEVVVHQGDTIDGIASDHPVKGLSAHELGYVISDINHESKTVSSLLMPGDRIYVPFES